MNDKRIIEVRRGNSWKVVEMKQLKLDDVFRMFEDGQLFCGGSHFVVAGKPTVQENNFGEEVWGVEAEEIDG